MGGKQQTREYLQVVLTGYKVGQGTGIRHNHAVHHVHPAVFGFVVGICYFGEGVYEYADLARCVVCAEADGGKAVCHGFIVECAFLEGSGFIGFAAFGVNYAVEHDVLSHGVGSLIDVVVGSSEN